MESKAQGLEIAVEPPRPVLWPAGIAGLALVGLATWGVLRGEWVDVTCYMVAAAFVAWGMLRGFSFLVRRQTYSRAVFDSEGVTLLPYEQGWGSCTAFRFRYEHIVGLRDGPGGAKALLLDRKVPLRIWSRRIFAAGPARESVVIPVWLWKHPAFVEALGPHLTDESFRA